MIEEQQKMIEDLHSENEALKEENLQLHQKIDDLTQELQNPERDIEGKGSLNFQKKLLRISTLRLKISKIGWINLIMMDLWKSSKLYVRSSGRKYSWL